jgi:hypothetical protein
MFRTKFINLEPEKIVYSIIGSGAFKPQSASPEDIAEEMANYAMLVKQAVLEAIQREQAQRDLPNA